MAAAGHISGGEGVPGPTCDEFLRSVFHDLEDTERCWVAQFKESPKSKDPSKWIGHPHDPSIPGKWVPACNTYFSIASFANDSTQRTVKNATAVHCIVLDDVGQKIPMAVLDRLPPPSWVIETSAGCHQVGWVLRTPAAIGEARPVLDFLGKAGLGDTGGQSVVRYMRCPQGINNKDTALDEAGQPFVVTTLSWNPERKIELNTLEFALHAAITLQTGPALEPQGEAAKSPGATKDPIVAFLRSRQMLLSEVPSEQGYLDIGCPFASEHSSEGGTGYRPASPLQDSHFHCFHSHGPSVTTDRFHQWCLNEGLDKSEYQNYRRQIHATLVSSQKPLGHLESYSFDPALSALGLPPLDEEPPAPRFIIDGLLPDATIGIALGTGGIGKTTRRLEMAVHIVLGRKYCGRDVLRPGPVIYVTGEDTRKECEFRLHHICRVLKLTPDEKLIVARDLHIVDLVGKGVTFLETKVSGDFVQSASIDQFTAAYKSVAARLVVVDPKIAFATGAEDDNTANRKFMDGCARMSTELDCCVLVVHHISKEMARNKTVDQHVGRGGSALADAARFVFVEVTHSEGDAYSKRKIDLPLGVDPHDVQEGNVTRLHIEKLTYAPRPKEPIWQVRKGYEFRYVEAIYPDAESDLDRIQKIVQYLKDRTVKGLYDSKNSIEAAVGEMCMTRNAARKAISDGLQIGMLAEIELPEGVKKGGFKTAIVAGAVSYAQAKEKVHKTSPVPPTKISTPPLQSTSNAAA